jgi:predicted RNase H-like nuclease (RuvC/YqgF family)
LKAAELQTGFLAQEVEAAAESVGYDFHGVDKPKNENDFYGLRYAEFVVPLVKAVQEQQNMIIKQKSANEAQQQTIETLKAEISNMTNQDARMKSLEQENTTLKARLDRLEKLIEKAN